jgi:class 3 adenylate cyclase
MSANRRLAAILAADVAGYSRLMGADEVGTAQALREHRAAADPLIAQHGGRIVKTTGDGVLVEFGWSAPSNALWGYNGWPRSAMRMSTSSAAWNGASASILATC